MIKPDNETIRAFAHVSQNVPRVGKYLEEWYSTELGRLPVTANNVAIAQGRCQILGELCKLLSDSTEA